MSMEDELEAQQPRGPPSGRPKRAVLGPGARPHPHTRASIIYRIQHGASASRLTSSAQQTGQGRTDGKRYRRSGAAKVRHTQWRKEATLQPCSKRLWEIISLLRQMSDRTAVEMDRSVEVALPSPVGARCWVRGLRPALCWAGDGVRRGATIRLVRSGLARSQAKPGRVACVRGRGRRPGSARRRPASRKRHFG